MVKRNTENNKVNESSELETKVQQADPMIKQAFSEYKKEIMRLQKQLVKEQIAHNSEKEYFLECIKQGETHITVQSFDKEKR